MTRKKNMTIAAGLALVVLAVFLLLFARDPEFGSEDWCDKMRDKPKVEWTGEEVKGFTNYCVGRDR